MRMTEVMRFVVRNDGLVIGALFKNQTELKDIEPHKVYLVISIDGDLRIKSIGDMPDIVKNEFDVREVSYFLNDFGKYAYLTSTEYQEQLDKVNGSIEDE